MNLAVAMFVVLGLFVILAPILSGIAVMRQWRIVGFVRRNVRGVYWVCAVSSLVLAISALFVTRRPESWIVFGCGLGGAASWVIMASLRTRQPGA